MITADRIMVALDVDQFDEAKTIVSQLSGSGVTLKVGNQLGTYAGWQQSIEFARSNGLRIFCDTKFKDIPETVKKSSRAITRHQPDFYNVMADTQPTALEAAMEGRDAAVGDFDLAITPMLLGVTVLTSYTDEDTRSVYGADATSKVLQFATACADAGLDGVVCSAAEAKLLRSNDATKHLKLITPGIRPSWATSGDQSRVITPSQAVANGVDYLVIGRPITQPPPDIGSPANALQKIMEELS